MVGERSRKECARLDKVVPMVNVLATNEIEESFQHKNPNIKIPKNTPIHCSIVNANRDKKKSFKIPMNSFRNDRI
jgi:cytochrome P450